MLAGLVKAGYMREGGGVAERGTCLVGISSRARAHTCTRAHVHAHDEPGPVTSPPPRPLQAHASAFDSPIKLRTSRNDMVGRVQRYSQTWAGSGDPVGCRVTACNVLNRQPSFGARFVPDTHTRRALGQGSSRLFGRRVVGRKSTTVRSRPTGSLRACALVPSCPRALAPSCPRVLALVLSAGLYGTASTVVPGPMGHQPPFGSAQSFTSFPAQTPLCTVPTGRCVWTYQTAA